MDCGVCSTRRGYASITVHINMLCVLWKIQNLMRRKCYSVQSDLVHCSKCSGRGSLQLQCNAMPHDALLCNLISFHLLYSVHFMLYRWELIKLQCNAMTHNAMHWVYRWQIISNFLPSYFSITAQGLHMQLIIVTIIVITIILAIIIIIIIVLIIISSFLSSSVLM